MMKKMIFPALLLTALTVQSCDMIESCCGGGKCSSTKPTSEVKAASIKCAHCGKESCNAACKSHVPKAKGISAPEAAAGN